MPKTSFVMPGDQPETTLYVTWRDKRGEQAEIFPINFHPGGALAEGQKKLVGQLWTAWISFREYNGLLVYFTHLVSYRCGIKEVRYGLEDGPLDEVWPMPECNPNNPHAIPNDAKIYRNIPETTKAMRVQVTYYDGTKSEVKTFNVKF